jgi:predicted amidohydrolase YtcJ
MRCFNASLVLAGRVVLVAGISLTMAQAEANRQAPADLVLEGGNIYTVDAARSVAAALAVRDGRVVFVGTTAEAKRWIGPHTRVEELAGRLVLPGLVDAHIHPLDIVDLDVCDLDSHPLTRHHALLSGQAAPEPPAEHLGARGHRGLHPQRRTHAGT